MGINDLTPRYSPDGFRIIFVNRVNDDLSAPDIWTTDLDGNNRSKIFSNVFLPDWKQESAETILGPQHRDSSPGTNFKVGTGRFRLLTRRCAFDGRHALILTE